MGLFPLAAAMVSATFCSLLVRQYRAGRKPHQLAWALAMAAFALASASAGVGMLAGWSAGLFRSYYLFGAVINVPVLALGTIYLYSPGRVGRLAAFAVAAAAVYATFAVLSADLRSPVAGISGMIPSGSAVMVPGVRLMSRLYSYTGFAVVVAGALWSAARLSRRPEARLRRLAQGNALIALGTVVVAAGSAFARYGRGTWFAVGLAAGVTVMFSGFIRTRDRRVAGATEPAVPAAGQTAG